MAPSPRVAMAFRDAALLALRPRDSAHSAIKRDEAMTRVGAAVARLVLLPVVGVSLCGAVTLLLTLQWVEALQRRRQQLQWRARLWAALLALLLALLPSKRLEAAVAPCKAQDAPEEAAATLYRRGKRNASTSASQEARPVKKKRSGEESEKEQQEKTRVGEEAPKPVKAKTVKRRVFIWDLDETLVLFASLYTGTFAQTHGKEVAPGVALGEQMMTFLLAMLERHFFFSDLHDADVDHIGRVEATSAGGSEEGLLQQEQRERYERIREIYERRGHVDFLQDATSEWFAIRRALVSAIDAFSTGWLREARQVLELITSESALSSASDDQEGESTPSSSDEDDQVVENVNVLVTNTQLVPALCKCLIYQLDAFFPIDRVYSSAKIHKYRCFETIMAKYQAPGVEFVAIGDGLEEEQVSLALGLEFHKIRSLVDLKRLRYDLQLVQTRGATSAGAASAVVSPATVAAMPVASPVGQTAVV